MAETDEEVANRFMARRAKNLAYFQKYRPEIFNYFADFRLDHIELVITPSQADVDMTDHGRSVYRNHARAFSHDEAKKFLAENPSSKRMRTLAPPYKESFSPGRFASASVRRCLEHSSINAENFDGYYRGKAFPSIVFLGCGLAYHIEALAASADIIDAVVFEPDAERFAVSLFTVDWEDICGRFRKKGCSIAFSIPTANSESRIREVLGNKLNEIVPLYPFLTLYYNHLANVELFKTAQDLERDLPILGANWGGYDFELRGLSNVVHNVRRGGGFIRPRSSAASERPVFVIGSGPSVDDRLEDIRQIRQKCIIISAGTGLRALLSNGIKPDFHLELDADYLIYEILNDASPEDLKGITLLASLEVNPLVPALFEKTIFYLKQANYIAALLELGNNGIPFTNPTCTNAAMAVAYALGFSNIYLFGTDYGYKKKERHHSRYSLYGDLVEGDFTQQLRDTAGASQETKKTFEVPGVDGGNVLTRADYYSAKRQVEQFIGAAGTDAKPLHVYNCSDGAVIEGATWLAPQAFSDKLKDYDDDARLEAETLVPDDLGRLPCETWKPRVDMLSAEILTTAHTFRGILRGARLNGRRDLVVTANEIRNYLNRVGPGSGRESPVDIQMMGYQMLKGTIQHFLYVGLCHGLAYEKDEDLVRFAKGWRGEFEDFLQRLPNHFRGVLLEEQPIASDPWTNRRLRDAEPGYDLPVA